MRERKEMDFHSDLAQAIACEFTREGISFPENADPAHLASRYLEMRIRRIEPAPRTVHFSDEIHDSLGTLARNRDSKSSAQAREAWRTVFHLRVLFATGGAVIPYLTERVNNTETTDGLLWDYAIHHLHLSRNVGKNGFVQRADWLLFAIVADQDVFFVDVRPHTDPEKIAMGATRPFDHRAQQLAGIDGNPRIARRNGRYGNRYREKGTSTKKRKPSSSGWRPRHRPAWGGGLSGDGHSIICRFLADKLLHELEQQQRLLNSHTDELRAAFVEKGMAEDIQMEFKLVRKGDLNLSADLDTEFCSIDDFSRTLWQLGFAVIETNTRSLCRLTEVA